LSFFLGLVWLGVGGVWTDAMGDFIGGNGVSRGRCESMIVAAFAVTSLHSLRMLLSALLWVSVSVTVFT
jgi:hypothetical protein